MKVANPEYINAMTEELLEPVNEMADSRDSFIRKIGDFREQIIMNFGKIILLKDVANPSLNLHWASELADLVMNIWKTKLNGDNKTKEKLKKLMDNSVDTILFSDKYVAKFPNYFKTAIKSETDDSQYVGTALYDYCYKISNDRKFDYNKYVETNLELMKYTMHNIVGHLRPFSTDEEKEMLKSELCLLICNKLNARYE